MGDRLTRRPSVNMGNTRNCFDFVPVPASRGDCATLAAQCESRCGGLIAPLRFKQMRESLDSWDRLDPQEQDDFRAAMGWRAALFLDDAWLWAELDSAGAWPGNGSRRDFHAWTLNRLDAVRQGMEAELPSPGRESCVANAAQVLALDLSRPGNPGQWVNHGGIDWTPSDTSLDNELVIRALRLYPHRTLAEAYAATGEARYLSAAMRMLADLTWMIAGMTIRRVGVAGPRCHWGVDALDVAIRTVNLLRLVAAAGTGLDPDMTVLIWKTLYLCGVRSSEFWHKAPHNIIFYEPAALGRLGFYFPAFRKAASWREAAQHRLTGALKGAIMADGSNVEGAFGYHNAYLFEPWGVVEAARFAGLPLDARFESAYRAKQGPMLEYWAKAVTPSRTLPQLGDTWLGEVTDVLARFGAVFQAPLALAVASDNPEDQPRQTAFYLPVQRFAAMRSGWDRESLWCGFNLRGFHYGHDHYDLFHVELQGGASRLLLDSGCIDYNANRERSRASAAHNTLTAEGADLQPGAAVDIRWHTGAAFDWCEGLSLAGAGFRHRRAVCFLKPDVFLVLDRVEPTDTTPRRYDLRWHLPPGCQVITNGLTARIVEAGGWQLSLTGLGDEAWTLETETGFVVDGAFSTPRSAPVLRMSAPRSAGFHAATVFRASRAGPADPPPVQRLPVAVFNADSDMPVPQERALAVQVGSDTVLWCEPGYGTKRAGDWETDGELLIARGRRAAARGASCAAHRGMPVSFRKLKTSEAGG